jgi:hypothetical protein
MKKLRNSTAIFCNPVSRTASDAAYRLRHVENDTNQLDLERLRSRLREKPRTKVGQVRQAWPYIKELFEAGHSLKDVCAWLNEIGVQIGYARLSHYVGQLRRAEPQRLEAAIPLVDSALTGRTIPPAVAPADVPTVPPHDNVDRPLANLVERDRNRPGFHYNSDPDPRKLI